MNSSDNNFRTYPPKKLISSENLEDLSIYSNMIDNFSEGEEVAKVIRSDGNVLSINKKNLEDYSSYLGNEIEDITKVMNRQIRIFAVIGASFESLILMLASARIKSHHCICFEDLSSEAISKRVKIFKPDIVLCRPKLKQKTHDSLIMSGLLNINIKIIDSNNFILKKDYKILNKPKNYKPDDELFTLFTSGSTGQPKAIVHSALKYYSYAKFSTKYYFGLNKNSVMFTATDAGWINGHTYAFYGPLGLGSKTVICEDLSKLANPIFLLEIIQKQKITCFYSSVTLIRLLRSKTLDNNDLYDDKFNNNLLDRIGSCGEPLADEVGKWAIEFLNPLKKTIVNTYFQTETGGIIVAPKSNNPLNYSSVGKPRKELNIYLAKDIYDDKVIKERKLDPNELIIKDSWEGIFKKVISDRQTNYFTDEGYYRLHDVGFYNEEGFLFIGGRRDDVINTAGHRISTAEIESICLSINFINEASAVPIKDFLIGEKIVLFISISNNQKLIKKDIYQEVNDKLNKKLSKFHLPSDIYLFSELPKTKSGKIVRRVMKQIANNYYVDFDNDYSTIANLEAFKKCELLFFKQLIRSKKENYLFDFEKLNSENLHTSKHNKTLFIFILEIIENISRDNTLSFLKDIYIRLVNKQKINIGVNIKISENDSLLQIYETLENSEIKNESCMRDIEEGMIQLNLENGFLLNIFFYKEKNEELIFRLYLYENSLYSDASYRKLLNSIFDKYRIFTNNQSSKIFTENKLNADLVQNADNVLSPKNINYSKEKIYCLRCRVTPNEMKRIRGEKSFMMPILNNENENAYICDLCLMGW